MKWLLLLLPFWLQGQGLKPGIYYSLQTNQPLVLDTGSYTFIGLEMRCKVPPSGVRGLLDARKAKSLTLLHCTFEGNGNGTAVLSSGDLTVDHCTFKNMQTGIRSATQAGTTETLTLTGNTFTDLGTSIRLEKMENSGTDPTTLNFTLKCNEFINTPQTTTSFTRKGLVIGEGVKVRAPNNLTNTSFLADQIGGSAALNTNGTAYPNANVWPTAQEDRGIRPTDPLTTEPADLHHPAYGWVDSPHWVPIENNSGTSITYHRYNNEFVKNDLPLSTDVAFPFVLKKIATLANVNDPVHPVDPNDLQYEFACDNLTDPVTILFPARIAVVGSGVTGSKADLILEEALLEDASPNPSGEETRIGLYVPLKAESAVLQILETGTGRVLQNILVAEKGKLEILLETRKAPAAIYTYRLLVDGKPVGVRKLVVQH